MSDWFRSRWKGEDRSFSNWEDARSRQSEPEAVLQGIHRLRRRVDPREPKAMGLLDSGNIGRTLELDVSAVFQDVVNLESNDSKARTVTIHCVNESVPGVLPTSVGGRIVWGSGGAQASAEFDWLQGTTLTVSGSFVRVSARALDQTVQRVGAFACYDNAGEIRKPQFSQSAGTINAGLRSADITVPSYADEVIVHRGRIAVPAPGIRVIALASVGSPGNLYAQDFSTGVPMTVPMRLANIVRKIAVVNLDPVNPVEPFVIFGLNL